MLASIGASVQEEIQRRLSAVEADHGVRLLIAVESGSRAWGFPSPDSDYDAQFLYVGSRDSYLALEAGRDVIEQPITDEIDLNGWDIRKALGLMLKSNVVVSEWLSSPIRYRPDVPAMEQMAELAERSFNPRGAAQHYARLGQNAADRWLDGEEDVPVKRYFYALRPALAIRALRLNPFAPSPMNLQQLVKVSDLSAEQVGLIEQLVSAKSMTRELGNAYREPILDALIRNELVRADEVPVRPVSREDRADANQLFLDLVNT